jgi:hypothetical protein
MVESADESTGRIGVPEVDAGFNPVISTSASPCLSDLNIFQEDTVTSKNHEKKTRYPRPSKKVLQSQLLECGTPNAVHGRFYSGVVTRQTVWNWCVWHNLNWSEAKEDLWDRKHREI